jgi:hypothetical protein
MQPSWVPVDKLVNEQYTQPLRSMVECSAADTDLIADGACGFSPAWQRIMQRYN